MNAIAAELLSAASHIRLLKAESRKQKKQIADLGAEVVALKGKSSATEDVDGAS